MNHATLEGFRRIAETMFPEPHDWQWIGAHMSQRMFGITEARAKSYAQRHGGEAKPMEAASNVVRATIREHVLDDHKINWTATVFRGDELIDSARSDTISALSSWLRTTYPNCLKTIEFAKPASV